MNGCSAITKLCGRLGAHAREGTALVLATLREIFDESAYTRFLAREGLQSSSKNYAAFLREHHAQRARRPKCC